MAKQRGRGARPEDLARSTRIKAPDVGSIPLPTDVGIYGGGLGGPAAGEGKGKGRGRGRGKGLLHAPGQQGLRGVGQVNRAVRAAQQGTVTPIRQSSALGAQIKGGGSYQIPPGYGGGGGGGGGGHHHHHGGR